MAAAKGGSKKERKGKKKHVNKQTSTKYKFYKDGKTSRKHCPRCGPGTFLAQHKGRVCCGSCHYTEFDFVAK